MANMLMMRYAARKRDERGRYMEDGDAPEMIGYGGDEPRRYAGYGDRTGFEPPMNRYRDRPDEYYTRNAEDYKRGIRGGFWMDDPNKEEGYRGKENKPHRTEKDDDDEEDEGSKRKKNRKMTKEDAEEWVDSMEGTDPAKPHGGKWRMDDVKLFAQKAGFPHEGEKFVEFWAVMNAMYADYFDVAKKYGMAGNPEFFADMAKAFIHDKDAVEDKVSAYYNCIVKK